MATQDSDGARTPSRAIAVTAFGLLMAAGVMLLLALVVGPSESDVGTAATQETPVAETEESGVSSVADTAAPSTSPAPTTSPARPEQEATNESGAPGPDTSAPQADPTGDGIAVDDAESRVPEPPDLTVLNGPFAAIDVTRKFACGLLIDGRAECWGSNFERSLPVPSGEFTALESLEIENCALRIDQSAVCWQQSLLSNC